MTDKRNRRGDDDDRVSLAPLDPEQALRALLKVDPESKPAEDRPEDTRGPEKK
jgi:hypothetical protein